jgi:hypothetical protein
MKMKNAIFLLFTVLLTVSGAWAQNNGGGTDQSQPTILSARLSGGYGIGRARENIGTSGGDPVWWSGGQGVKMDAALDLPLVPIEVINSGADENEPERFSVVGLELELASGYHISDGTKFTTSSNQTLTKKYTYVPVTLGFNVRTSFGAGLPSVYIGAGGGIYWNAIYADDGSVPSTSTTIHNEYTPPIPFVLYGQMGLEIPLMYSSDDGNSLIDLFVQARLSEVTNYIYDYKSTVSTPTSTATTVVTISNIGRAEPASNVAFTLGIKFNIY